MTLTLQKTLILVGMMGAGKTAVGKAVAASLAVPFHDSDEEIERAANRTIAEIFARDGEAFFRQRESLLIARLLEGDCGVVSVGGGAFLERQNRALIRDKGVSLWLRADPLLLWSRVRHKDTRPLLRTADPFGTLLRLHKQRAPVYAEAELVVDAQAGHSVADTAAAVIRTLRTRDDLLREGAG